MSKKDKETAIDGGSAELKKRKRDQKEKTKPAEEGSFLGAPKDAELDDVFNKGAAYVRPVEITMKAQTPAPVASSSKPESVPSDQPQTTSQPKKKSKHTKAVVPEESDEDEVESRAGPSSPAVREEDEDEDEDLAHETLKKPKKVKVKAASTKYTPPGETSADKDRRTVFVGNLPIEIAKSKSVEHQLRAHLVTFAPNAKIESIRYRSVAFAQPTAEIPGDDPEKDEARRAKREKERIAAWKASQDEGGKKRGDEETEKPKMFLDEKGKRKVAFIKKDFHSELESCNAYVVFAHPHPDRPTNVAPILDPFTAASSVLAANGSTFLERTIRVDSLRLPSAVALASATTALGKRDAWLPSGTDPKKSLFVGGLDYAAKEEDLRVFFEELVKTERGASEGRYVTGVRLIRDRETQLGKGFGYVHFADRESADEILALDSKKLKFAKKPLRVQPCKTLPPTVKVPPKSAENAVKSKTPYVKPASMPKGNPLLGEKIKDLPKDERKLVKATDADRQARRLAKKKLRMGMEKKETGAIKVSLTKADRDKVRKAPKAKKGRVRSGNALKKMKGSRT